MRVTILAIGRKHEPKLLGTIEDYSKRLSHYTSIEWKLTEARITGSMSESEIKTSESQVLLNQISDTDTVILLDETGDQLTSPALAEKLQNYMNQSAKNLVFILGGAYGVSEEIMNRANFVWSLSRLVFPHQLVRLILIEQLYRAFTIINNEKYHHK